MTLWFILGFYLYVIKAIAQLISMIGSIAEKTGITSFGRFTAFCGECFGIVFIILGCVWRWGENGTLASCYKMSCMDGKGEPEDLLGSGYQYKAGKFMNIFLIICLAITAVPLALCMLCLPLCCICICLSAKKWLKQAKWNYKTVSHAL